MKGKILTVVGVFASLLALLSGCQVVFTYSPLSILQRDPAAMSLEQKVTYAADALASGDDAAILGAFNAIQADASGSTDGELNLLAAQLAMELSGVPDLLNEVLGGGIDFENPDPAQFTDLLDSLDTGYLLDASPFYQDANTNGGELGSVDFLLGAACILFEGTPGTDVAASTTTGTASDFLQYGIDDPAVDDPARDILAGFQSFIDGL